MGAVIKVETDGSVWRISPGIWKQLTGADVESDLLVAVLPDPPWSTCEWEWDEEHGLWETECEGSIILHERTPIKSGMQFCPFCRKQISE